MPQQRKQKETKFKLTQPDRSGPDPSVETLLEIAQKRGLAKAQRDRQAELDAEGEEILIGRLGDSILWTISLTMLHLTLDVLVTHQYAVDLVWKDIFWRTAQAFPGLSVRADNISYLASSIRSPPTSRTFENTASAS
ncbi:deacetylase protein [Rutstroemia sp. NJR-2017a WRK4]|nr:deacetylase protein [Rutstroemia sp. NJR-2017a WRK4]